MMEYVKIITGQWSHCREGMHGTLMAALTEENLGLMGTPMTDIPTDVDAALVDAQSMEDPEGCRETPDPILLCIHLPELKEEGIGQRKEKKDSTHIGDEQKDPRVPTRCETPSGTNDIERDLKEALDGTSVTDSDPTETGPMSPRLRRLQTELSRLEQSRWALSRKWTETSDSESETEVRMPPRSPRSHHQPLDLRVPTRYPQHRPLDSQKEMESSRREATLSQEELPSPTPSSRQSSSQTLTRTRTWGGTRNPSQLAPCLMNLYWFLALTITMISFLGMINGQDHGTEKREYDLRKRSGINFTAFDCTQSYDKKWRGLDLTEVGNCPDGDTDYLPPETVTVSLVQTHVPIIIKFFQCDIRMSKRATRHDMRLGNSGATGFETIFENKRVTVDGPICRAIAITRTFTCTSRLCDGASSGRIGIELGIRRGKTWLTRGNYDEALWPETEQFHQDLGDGITKRFNAIEETTLDILIEEHEAFLDLDTGTIWSEKLPFRSKYGLSSVSSDAHGTLAWDTRKNIKCTDKLAVISTSDASVRKLIESKRPGSRLVNNSEFAGAMVIVRNATSRRAAGIVVSEFRDPCINSCAQTNIPKLVICIDTDVTMLDQVADRANTLTTALRINQQSQGTYLEMTSNLNLYDLHRQMQEKLCELDVRTTKQDFAFLLNAKSAPYALQGMSTGISEYRVFGENQTAYTVAIRGSTGYFTRCKEENVEIVPLSNCTLQIPIIRENGRLSFADAINHHIMEYPTWVDCEQGLPVQYRIGDEYFCHTRNSHKPCPVGQTPTILQPSVGAARGIKIEDMPVLGGLTLTAEQIDKVGGLMEQLELGPLIVDDITEKVMHNTRNIDADGKLQTYFGLPLTEMDFQAISYSVAYNMFFLFRWLGDIYLNLFGIFVIFSVLKHVVDTGLRMWFLYRRHGFGPWILRSCWLSVWAAWALPKTILMRAKEAVDDTLEKARNDALPPVDTLKMHGDVHELRSALRDLHDSHKRLIMYSSGNYPTEFAESWRLQSQVIENKLNPFNTTTSDYHRAPKVNNETLTSILPDTSEDEEERTCITCGEQAVLGVGQLGVGGRCRKCRVPPELPKRETPTAPSLEDKPSGDSPNKK